MRALHRTARLAALVAVVGLSLPGPSQTAAAAPIAPGQAADELTLLSHTPTVAPKGRLDITVDLGATPADGSVTVVLHNRVRSRSELSRSMEGEGLRTTIYEITRPVSELPASGAGRRLSLSLDPTQPDGVSITAAGAYPVELIARDATGTETARLVTHLLVEPPTADESPPLAVSVLLSLGVRPVLQPDGGTRVPTATIEDMVALTEVLVEAPSPVTLAVAPESIDGLRTSTDPAGAALLERLAEVGPDHPALVMPYAPVSPDALAGAGLDEELARQLDAGRSVLTDALGSEPDQTTWLAAADLGPDGTELLASEGITRVVVSPDQVEPLRSGLVSLSLAQPFVVGESGSALEALALDEAVIDRLDTGVPPALEANRLLAELAMLWFERPGVPRAVVVPVDQDTRPEVLARLLEGLAGDRILTATPLDAAFEAAEPLRQPGGNLVDRDLRPDDSPRISSAVTRELRGVLDLQASLTAMIGHDDARLAPMAHHLRLATSSAVSVADQRAHLDVARATVADVVGSVSAPEKETITLTAREGTVPLTLVNDATEPVNVTVHLSSTKLNFPDGDTIPITLQPGSTRIDISVEVLASGAFPLEVEVTSPDGDLHLTNTDYSIRSTAVSGVGVFLSAGAAVFLVAWWARHWRRTRRSSKLVEATSETPDESDVPARP